MISTPNEYQKKCPAESSALFDFGGPGRNRPGLRMRNPIECFVLSLLP